MTKKRIGAVILALTMMMLLVSCAGSPEDTSVSSGGGALFDEPAELSVVISSHSSYPYREDWKIWEYFQQETGARFKISTMPNQEVSTKVTLMMADRSSLPDLLHLWTPQLVDKHAESGAFISLSGNMDKLPAMQAFLDTLPETRRNELLNMRTSGDGEIYSAPAYGKILDGQRTWMYRKDIFEKHQLEVPRTYEDIYEVSKKLKELYPDSYPLCLREGLRNLEILSPSWKKYFTYNFYYDFDSGEWNLGILEPVAKEMVEYFSKMHREGLVTPDFLTLNTKTWEELMSTDRAFITLDYITRLDFFNLPNRENNPDYMFASMPPPVPSTPSAQPRIANTNVDFYGYTIPDTGKQQNIENAFKVINWMYTDEGSELLSWGKEGETYTVENGRRKFILQGEDTPAMAYGVGTYGTYQHIRSDAVQATYSEEQVEEARKALENVEDHVNPELWLAMSEEELSRLSELKPEIGTYINEYLSKFLLGQSQLSEWDAFVRGALDMGAEEVLGIYKTAYDRIISGK